MPNYVFVVICDHKPTHMRILSDHTCFVKSVHRALDLVLSFFALVVAFKNCFRVPLQSALHGCLRVSV
jgi:hypothetical protein